MSWEDRFSSIVRETESNLARVRERLSVAHSLSKNVAALHTSSPLETSNYLTKYSSGLHHVSCPSPMTPSPPSLFKPVSVPYYSKPTSHHDSLQWDMTPESHHVPIEQSSAVISLLSEKLENQSRELASLKKQVKTLEQERDEYQRDLREIRGSLSSVQERLAEKGVDLQTERKMDEWKRRLTGEIHDLQRELERYKGRDDDRQYGESQLGALSREVQELRTFTRDECETIRRDIETTRTRIVRLELEFSSMVTESKEITRRQDKLDKSYHYLSDTQLNHSKTVNKTFQDQDEERLQIQELRETMLALRDKLDHMESSGQNGTVEFGHSGFLTKTKDSTLHDAPQKKVVLNLDDITLSQSTDLADYESSDFSFTPKNRRKDLGLDEDLCSLNLTDDDTETLTNYDISISDLKR